MFDVFHTRLEARLPSRNIMRFYEVSVGRDLFDEWQVATRNGRIGARGQLRYHTAESREAAMRVVRQILKRRASAPKRIGVAYTVVDQSPDQ
jgi:predicted DNA-binding WGR domain protein